MKQIQQTCPECKRTFKGNSEIGLKRVFNLHMRTAHGVPGLTSTDSGKRFTSNYNRLIAQGLSPAEAKERADELAKRFKAKRGGEAQQLLLDRCPRCKNEFLVRNPDGKLGTIELPSCATCNIYFWYTE